MHPFHCIKMVVTMKEKKNRRLKVYGQSNGYNYQDVPTIVPKISVRGKLINRHIRRL